MKKLRYRQIHLDFHTSPHISLVGDQFDRTHWQRTLRKARVDSITCFATCHHGWSYYDTKIGKRHPGLNFDLLKAQVDACKEIDIQVPVYLTAGVNNQAAAEHPEWLEVDVNGCYTGWARGALEPGFRRMCFNTPYLDYLCGQIEEVAQHFPQADGLFFDIASQQPCCCPRCLETMQNLKLNPEREEDRKSCAQWVLDKYYERTTAAARVSNPKMPVFHNSGHIPKGSRDILKYVSHLELESLPTGGWGYDHFPMSAKYCSQLDLDFLGMTGKFHTTWGEFGGFKHSNALRYECAAMLAYGAKCSVGDQLAPSGRLDDGTYELIGATYAEVEEKEPWCRGAQSVAEIGLLSSEAARGRVTSAKDEMASDIGAGRILLEGQFLFDVLDCEMDFSGYKALILPDDVQIGPELKAKLDAYLAGGGRLLLSGRSGLNESGDAFLFDVGAELEGESPFCPDYILPEPNLQPDFCRSPFVMYMPSQRINVTDGESLGEIYDPYFNRSYKHFCSHQHAPARPEPSGYAAGSMKENVLYLAHPVFSIYRAVGSVVCKAYVINMLRYLLGDERLFESNLPSSARVTLMHQEAERRFILHLLHAAPQYRGGEMELSGGTSSVKTAGLEVIEDLLSLHAVQVRLRLDRPIQAVTLEPQGAALPFMQQDRSVEFTVNQVVCHQMIVLQY